MWMYFESDKAWNFLREHGEVYTLRGPAKSGRATISEIIVILRRHGKDTGFRAVRKFVREIIPNVTVFEDEWIEKSGFDSEREWLQEAEHLSGIQPYWRLFHVKIL